jgi:cytochrome c2
MNKPVVSIVTIVASALLLGAAHAQDYTEANLKQADVEAGEKSWQENCALCHTIGKDQAAMVGPNLYQLFKRKVGTQEGFKYSEALLNEQRPWTPVLFAQYVQSPQATIPGNVMPAVSVSAEQVFALTAYVMRASSSVDWDAPTSAGSATGGLDAELQADRPEFWAQYMDNTIKFTLPRDNGETYSFVAYFNPDGTITGNNRGLNGIWRMRDKRKFCYSIERVGVHPFEWMHCVPPKATKNLAFGEVVESFVPVKGHDEFKIDVSWLEGRPFPLEGDAHPDYWTFLFANTSRYEIKVDGETVIVDAQFNKDKSITSPQGINGEWFTKGSDGKEDTMCYFLEDVPGVDGKLGECFALVLMFNPRVGARWPSRFEQGNSYWAEITEGRE